MQAIKPVNFIKAQRLRGCLVIESDDGYTPDFTHWFPLMNKYKQNDRWYPFNHRKVLGNVGINSLYVGNEGRMTKEQITELEDNGWEIMNHNKTHTRLNEHVLTQPASAGTNRIFIDFADRVRGIFQYRIWNGSTEEIVTNKSYIAGTDYIEIEGQLVNSYPQGAKMELTEASLQIEINNGLDELLALGWNVENHIVPYHFSHELSRSVIAERHHSARTVSNGVNTDRKMDKHLLKGYLDGNLSESLVNQILEETYNTDGLCIIYGHGSKYGHNSILDYVIKKAIEKNVLITTRREANKRFFLD